MSQKRAKVRTTTVACCPAHTTSAIAGSLADKWLQDVRDTAVNGGVDAIAAIVAAEMIKRSMTDLMERGYAAHGPEAVESFQRDLAEALAGITPIPNPEAS